MPVHRDIVVAPGSPTSRAGRGVIAVIGIDRYRSWRGLSNAVSDASGARALFHHLGFVEVTPPLFDERATGHAIRTLVTDELSTLGHGDSLVVFFAGHGGTRTQYVGDREVKTGYLIPTEASDRFATWIGLEDWLYRISLLPPRHILVILDACHSGIALSPTMRWRDAGTAQHLPLATLQARRSRVVITSALDSEVALDSGPVHGHSLFTGCLIQGLMGGLAGDLLHDSRWVTTGTRMGLYLQNRVLSFPEHERRGGRQTPDFGRFDYDDRGEMVIPLLLEERRTSPPAVIMPPPVTTPPRVVYAPPAGITAPPAILPASPPMPLSSWPDPLRASAAEPAPEPSRWQTMPVQAADALEATVPSAPAQRRHDGYPWPGQPAVTPGNSAGDRKILGIPLARLRDPGLQKKILFLAGVALIASVVVPFSLSPLVFAWSGGGFEFFLWPLISGAAYLLLTAAPRDRRNKVPPVILQWIPFGVSYAGIFISHMGFGFALYLAAAVGSSAGLGVGGLYVLGYSLLVFGLLARIAQPQDRVARIIIAGGAACLIPSFLDSLRLFSTLGLFPILLVVHNLLFVLIQAIGVFCIAFALRPPVLQTEVAFGRRIAAALILWPPLQQVLFALAGIIHHHVLINPLLMLGHGLLPILAYFGVLVMASPAAYEEAKLIFARRGGQGPGGGYSGGGGYPPQGGGYPPQQAAIRGRAAATRDNRAAGSSQLSSR